MNNWSKSVTEHSNALKLEPGVFTLNNPTEIAYSLANSAEKSTNRKSSAYKSAMSMLSFYINRAGKKLNNEQRTILEQAKEELRNLYTH